MKLCWMLLTPLMLGWAVPAAAERVTPAPWQRAMKPLLHKKPASAATPGPVLASTPAQPPAATTPSAPRIKYVGSLQRGGQRFVFAEVNGQVYSVRSGAELAGIYRLVEVSGREAKFVYLPTNENFLVSMD